MIYCYVDGGYKNDGTGYSNLSGYGSYLIKTDDPEWSESGLIEYRTFKLPEAKSNNEAEYLSLIELIEALLNRGFKYDLIHINMDSQLVVNQVNGNWKINYKNLQLLLNKVKSFNLDFELKWIPRSKIVEQLGH